MIVVKFDYRPALALGWTYIHKHTYKRRGQSNFNKPGMFRPHTGWCMYGLTECTRYHLY